MSKKLQDFPFNYGRVILRKKPRPKENETGKKVFNTISPKSITRSIATWVRKMGINKNITFHCARHTFATLSLTAGVDIYTTSKLLGHANVSTTQIYAKIVEAKKVEAIDAISNLIK